MVIPVCRQNVTRNKFFLTRKCYMYTHIHYEAPHYYLTKQSMKVHRHLVLFCQNYQIYNNTASTANQTKWFFHLFYATCIQAAYSALPICWNIKTLSLSLSMVLEQSIPVFLCVSIYGAETIVIFLNSCQKMLFWRRTTLLIPKLLGNCIPIWLTKTVGLTEKLCNGTITFGILSMWNRSKESSNKSYWSPTTQIDIYIYTCWYIVE